MQKIMFRRLYVLFCLLLGITLLLIIIHLRCKDYFENPSKDITENIYEGKTKISIYLSKYEQHSYFVHVSFNNIKSHVLVNDIDVELSAIHIDTSFKFSLMKVLAYNGMQSWDKQEFKCFSEVLDSLKIIDSSNNPYFGYDFIFSQPIREESQDFLVKIKLNFTEESKECFVEKAINIKRKNKLKLTPIDSHSDITFILIPIFGVLTCVLLLIIIVSKLKKISR